MRWASAIFILLLFFPLLSQNEKLAKTDFTPKLNFSYNNIRCSFGAENLLNRQALILSSLELDVDLFQYLTVGLQIGYNLSYPHDPVDFMHLPLSLRYSEGNFQGLVYGAVMQSEPFSFGDFTVRLHGECQYAKEAAKKWPISLPIKTGEAIGNDKFLFLTIDLLFLYDRLSGWTFFLGPRANWLWGKYTFSETIDKLTGSEELNYRQKYIFGPVVGFEREVGDNWLIKVEGSFLAREAVGVQIAYSF